MTEQTNNLLSNQYNIEETSKLDADNLQTQLNEAKKRISELENMHIKTSVELATIKKLHVIAENNLIIANRDKANLQSSLDTANRDKANLQTDLDEAEADLAIANNKY